MRKTLIAVAAALVGVAANVTISTEAQARCYGCWAGAAIAAGLIGSAIVANRAYGYGGYGYYGGYAPYYSGYYAPAYSYEPAYSYAPYYGSYYYPRRYYGYHRPYLRRAYYGYHRPYLRRAVYARHRW